MLRKTYQLMQKTRGVVIDARENIWRKGGRTIGSSFKKQGFQGSISFLSCPVDLWPGDPARGADLTSFALLSRDDFLCTLFSAYGERELDPAFHTFQWLLDVRAVGTDEARRAAARLVTLWTRGNLGATIDQQSFSVMNERLRRLVGCYSFFEPVLGDDDRKMIMDGVISSLYFLKKALSGATLSIDILELTSAILTIGLAASMPPFDMIPVLKKMERAVQMTVLVDGGPVTRRPGDLPHLLKIFVDLKNSFESAMTPVPVFIAHAIDKMAPGLRALRLGDGRMTTFQGGGLSIASEIDAILYHVGGSVATPLTLPYTGFERLAAGPSIIVMDAGRSPSGAGHHASTSAFEWSAAGTRVVVNCGTHATDPLWRDLLAATSAHSTLTMGHQDNTAVTGLADVDILRDDRGGISTVEIVHNGYETRNGFIHARKIILSQDGFQIKGEDRMETSVAPVSPLDYTIRFHLHPSVSAVMVHGTPREKSIISLSLPDGAIWQFHSNSDVLTVEDSVYLAETGKPVKTRQIILSGQIKSASKKIQWRFEAI